MPVNLSPEDAIRLEQIKKLRMVPAGTHADYSGSPIEAPANMGPAMPRPEEDARLAKVRQLRGMTQPQPDVVAPSDIANSPYLQASHLEQQMQPQPGPTSIMGKLGRAAMEGLASSGMPGGYAQFQQQQYQREQDRQQQLYQRVKDLRTQGMQQSQMYRQEQNQGLERDFRQQQANQEQAYRDEQLRIARERESRETAQANRPEFAHFGTAAGGELYGSVDPAGKFTQQGEIKPATKKAEPSEQVWVTRNGKLTPIAKGTAQPGDVPYDAVAARKDGDAGVASPYADERATRTIASVDELMGEVNDSFFGGTVGMGSLASGIPESKALAFKAKLDTLKANIGFNELTAMREASKTGGALGQVSERELALLTSALGALDQRMDAESLKTQLRKIRGSVERWQKAQAANNSGTTTPKSGGLIVPGGALEKLLGGQGK